MGRFVPYLAEEAIERDVTSLIAEYEHARGVTIEPPIPVEDIVEKHLKLRIEFDDMHARHNIPRPPNGQPDILGGCPNHSRPAKNRALMRVSRFRASWYNGVGVVRT